MTKEATWSEGPLREIIASFEAGVSVNGEDRPCCPGEAGVLKVSAVGIGQFRPTEAKAVPPKEAKRLGPSLRKGDILVTRANTHELVGAAALVPENYPTLHLSDKTWRVVLRAESDATRRWLLHVLNSAHVRAVLRTRATGTSGSMKNISQSTYLGICVPQPPEPERGRIADRLDRWAEAVVAVQGLLDAKRRFKYGLVEELLAGKRRHKKFEGQPWTRRRIGDLVSEIWRPVMWDESRTYQLTSVRRNAGGLFSRGSLQGRSIKVKRLFELRSGDLLISHIQAAYGAFGLVTKSFEGTTVSDLYSVLVPANGRADVRFLAHVFRQPRIWHLARRASNGFFAERLRLNFSPADFLSREILVPPTVAEQQMIAEVLDLADRELVLLEQLCEALDRQRRGVAELLLTGRVRTPA